MSEAQAPRRPFLWTLRCGWAKWRRGHARWRAGLGQLCAFHWEGAQDGLPGPVVRVLFTRFLHYAGERRAFVLGWDTKRSARALVLQRYGQGYDLEPHHDLNPDAGEHNDLVILVLKPARRGGEFIAQGPCRRLFGGRVLMLDGGQVRHGFTRIEEGVRWSLLYQHGWSDKGVRPS